MYQASTAFHEAVANGAPQKALLIFDDAIFTNDDIDVDAGIEMDDYFNAEEDLSIGQALSNEIRFTIFNDDRTLNNYAFGDFLATIGAKLSDTTYTHSGNVTIITANSTYNGYTSSPYMRRGGTTVSTVNFPVVGMMSFSNKVFAFGANGQCRVIRDVDGVDITSSTTVSPFMTSHGKRMNGLGTCYNDTTRMYEEFKGGIRRRYECVPLGWFTAKRPNVPDVNQIQFTCHDFMTKFDEDMPDAATLGVSYPITFSNLFVRLCEYVGVSYASTTFINSTAVLTSEPDEFKRSSMRNVLQWIAEAAASNVRFNRDGQLAFDWIRSTSTALTETNYIEFNPYWYETPVVDKLYNRNTESGTDRTVGTGNNGYLIQDNPLLKGVN